jgi:hemerythrin-like domain-containing protein
MDSLFDSAPAFDQPIAVLKHCHDRIRKQLATLEKMLSHLQQHGADGPAQQAASAVLRYFQQAAPLHHADEENDLLPTLERLAQGADATLLKQLLPKILTQHHEMDLQWQALESQLIDIASGVSPQLDAQAVTQFQTIYQDHMQIEETQIAPMALRLFNDQQMQKLGAAMQRRRGISPL